MTLSSFCAHVPLPCLLPLGVGLFCPVLPFFYNLTHFYHVTFITPLPTTRADLFSLISPCREALYAIMYICATVYMCFFTRHYVYMYFDVCIYAYMHVCVQRCICWNIVAILVISQWANVGKYSLYNASETLACYYWLTVGYISYAQYSFCVGYILMGQCWQNIVCKM